MSKLIWVLAGVVLCLSLGAVGAMLLLRNANGFSAREQPGAVEAWIARQARAMAMPADAKTRQNPIAESPEVLREAREHWADHCAACHSNNGSGDAQMGKNMYPHAPDMRRPETQNLSDGELFAIIQNGIRFTGMPGWGNGSSHDEGDSWKLVRFIRHLPNLTTEEEREMEALNPKTPDELKEEQEEKEFLNGGQSNEPNPHGHHH